MEQIGCEKSGQWYMVIDVALCHDCNNCFMADKDEHVGNDWPGYTASQPRHGHRWMNILRRERGQYSRNDVAYLPMPCQHCTNAPCVTADGAVYQREDGIVMIDPVKAKGHEECTCKKCARKMSRRRGRDVTDMDIARSNDRHSAVLWAA